MSNDSAPIVYVVIVSKNIFMNLKTDLQCESLYEVILKQNAVMAAASILTFSAPSMNY